MTGLSERWGRSHSEAQDENEAEMAVYWQEELSEVARYLPVFLLRALVVLARGWHLAHADAEQDALG